MTELEHPFKQEVLMLLLFGKDLYVLIIITLDRSIIKVLALDL
jgi:hypothetical protein